MIQTAMLMMVQIRLRQADRVGGSEQSLYPIPGLLEGLRYYGPELLARDPPPIFL